MDDELIQILQECVDKARELRALKARAMAHVAFDQYAAADPAHHAAFMHSASQLDDMARNLEGWKPQLLVNIQRMNHELELMPRLLADLDNLSSHRPMN